MSTIVLAYSGGLDTSVLLKKLILEGNQVVAMTVDLGESDAFSGDGARAVLDGVRSKAIALGAYDAILIDAREPFVSEYAFAALQANALYQNIYPLSAALSRPLIARLLVETAYTYGANAVAHGCTGKGNDQVRIELAVRALNPALMCRAPLREAPLSRPDAIVFAREWGIPISHTFEKPYSVDSNLWGRSIEAGVLEDPWSAPPEDAFAWTAPAMQSTIAHELVLEFNGGLPRLDGKTGAALVAELNAAGSRQGIGRTDLIEDRVVGIKSREVYECPGATILITAHRALERLVLTRDELRFKALTDQRYAELIYDGLWMQPLRDALNAFNATFAPRMSGEVRIRLHRGSCIVTGVRSPYALYRENLATYGVGDAFDHQAAAGFIALQALPLEAYARAVNAAKESVAAP